MKNVRIFLTVVAIVFAVAGTVAGKVRSAATMTGYELIPGPPVQCLEFITECHTTGITPCSINNHEVHANSTTSTSCGARLYLPD
jgi:hypothetical protein